MAATSGRGQVLPNDNGHPKGGRVEWSRTHGFGYSVVLGFYLEAGALIPCMDECSTGRDQRAIVSSYSHACMGSSTARKRHLDLASSGWRLGSIGTASRNVSGCSGFCSRRRFPKTILSET